jgi:hypothetical protein
MLITLDVNWTFATPPTSSPYPVDIYYRLVGTTTYTTTTISNGESGSGSFTIVNDTADTISNRDLPCVLEYEGYVVPTCAANAVDQRFAFTTTIPEDITDYMQCRGVQAECIAGGILAILPDPDPSLVFSTEVPPTIENFSGAGNSSLLPGITIVWTNPSNPTSTIAQIVVSSFNGTAGFDSTTTFDIEGVAGDKATPVIMTPTIITGCGSTSLLASQCYNGDSMAIPYFSTEGGIAKTCVNNVDLNDYDTTFPASIGTVDITEDYSCCQKSACKTYQLTWVGAALMPWITSFTFGYINSNNGQSVFNVITSSSGTLFISAIEDTIQVYGGQTNGFDLAAFLILGGVTITEIGPC